MADFVALRRTMVDTQLRTNKITDDRVLAAMGDIAREAFITADRADRAYVDEDLQTGPGRYLVEPMVFARLVQAAEIGPEDVVLDLACGTGYSSAVLGRLARVVVAVESDAGAVAAAVAHLYDAGIDNVVLEEGPVAEVWAQQGPYDAILVNGAIQTIPQALLDQLADGGRLCAVVRRGDGTGTAELHVKNRGVVAHRTLFDANTPLLEEFTLEEGFHF